MASFRGEWNGEWNGEEKRKPLKNEGNVFPPFSASTDASHSFNTSFIRSERRGSGLISAERLKSATPLAYSFM